MLFVASGLVHILIDFFPLQLNFYEPVIDLGVIFNIRKFPLLLFQHKLGTTIPREGASIDLAEYPVLQRICRDYSSDSITEDDFHL